MKDFRELKVWKKAHALALAVYGSTRHFPSEERYGLTAQIRRSAVSIPSNIAEGCGRYGDREFCRFLQIAMGSASETEYQLLLARDLRFLTENDFSQLKKDITEIRRMLNSLIQKVSESSTG